MKDLLRVFGANCGDVETSLIQCDGEGGIGAVLGVAIDVLLILIGAAAVIGIIVSGIQYSASAGDPAAMTKAKNRIFQIIIGIVAYGLLWGVLKWLIPGGGIF